MTIKATEVRELLDRNILADGFIKLNINEVFLPPILRDFIDNREKLTDAKQR